MKVDIKVVSDTVNSLKAAADLASAAKDLDDVPALKRKLAEMSSLLLSAHSAAVSTQIQIMDMMQENFELQAKLSKVERWESIASRYELVDFGGNTYAHKLKKESADGEPDHLLCSNCFQDERKSILQFSHDTATRQRLFKCPACSGDFTLGVRYKVEHRVNRRNDSGWAV